MGEVSSKVASDSVVETSSCDAHTTNIREYRRYWSEDKDTDMAEGRRVLSYGDSLLYEADVMLLEPRGWINDKIFGFALEYYATEQFKNISRDICFIAPEVSQFLKLCQGRDKQEIDDFLEALELQKKQFIIIPVNDSTSMENPGGSHWSTLVYSKSENKLVHFDSFGGYNSRHAENVKGKMSLHFTAFKNLPIIRVQCPQQQNYCDCGIYAIIFAEEVCNNIKQKKSNIFDVSFDVYRVSATRQILKDLIYSLAEKYM